jgi:RTX calcium-binding nonapeptide repeat (4 copies)/Lipase (class 3)
MITKQEYSLMAAAAYNDARGLLNQLDIAPLGWVKIASDGGSTGGILSSGLTVNAYQKGNEIVIACKGTDFLVDSNNSQTASDLIADIALGGSLGFSSSQLFQAALFYQQVKAQNPGATITFTGHSLGAGLASILSVWFNRPATIFADAPFEVTALNPIVMGYVAGFLALNGFSDPEFVSFINSYIFTYGAREAQVTSYYVKGEVLNQWLSALPFVAGTNNMIDIGGGDQLPAIGGPLTLHSIVLHSALLISDQLRQDTLVLPTLLARIFDDNLYAFKLELPNEDFLTKLLKQQIADGDPSSGMLTHFAADLNKLGTNIAGLNVAAQNAIIAQGIEWYYWQGTSYTGQEFFTQTGPLLQYTINLGNTSSTNPSANKALYYVSQWLDPILQVNGGFSISYNYDQWNIVAGDTAATATARDATKSQIYVGGGGADSFTGGNLGDVILTGAGNDTINGGLGNDQLYGGAGQDSYLFSGAWGNDTITDSDGQGSIKLGDASSPALTGGKKLLDNVWESDDHNTIYSLTGTAGAQNLVIGQRSTPGATTVSGTITVQGWVNGQLGINLDSAFAPAPISTVYNGDQRAPLSGTSYNWSATNGYDAAGNLVGGVAELNFADVIYGSAAADRIKGLGGNDALGGGAGTASGEICALKRAGSHYKNRSCSRYYLLGWRYKRHVRRDCQSGLRGYVQTHRVYVSGMPRQSEVRV